MPKFTVKTRRLIILGVILLACVGALVGKPESIALAITGLFAVIKSDSDEE